MASINLNELIFGVYITKYSIDKLSLDCDKYDSFWLEMADCYISFAENFHNRWSTQIRKYFER